MVINNLVDTLAEPMAPRKEDQIPKTKETTESQAMADPRKKSAGKTEPATSLTGQIWGSMEIAKFYPEDDIRGASKTLKHPADTATEPDVPNKRARTMGAESHVEVNNQQCLVDTAVESIGPEMEGQIPTAQTEADIQRNENIQTGANTETYTLDLAAESDTSIQGTIGETPVTENIPAKANIQATAEQHSISNSIPTTSASPPLGTTAEFPIHIDIDMVEETGFQEKTHGEANTPATTQHSTSSPILPTSNTHSPDPAVEPHEEKMITSQVSQAINAVIVGPLSDPDFRWHEESGVTISAFGTHMILSWEEHCCKQARKKPALAPALSRGPPASAKGKPKKKVRFDLPEVEG
ncbi:hypothetical protein BO78DRAFT_415088 [Aspergillus sclerotiicarbonarius CBS 121057]|uniref:Uncharacterized protein n=1 Tax=Aspergillus sclerotiicarbonarius (strain CBS 121057 / IBT 28362) TaxID=1448318 RepID=A0A319EY94_ASPSB|nr:hypothetical protein BO78DRAFT_415088 [Aspergillus sclerotiicarbonarius CBS 121057]